MDGLVFIKIGPILYSNFAMRCDFRHATGVARHLFWRFWRLT